MFPGHKGAIYSVSFSPDGKLLASAGEDRRIKIWDLAASKVLKDLRGHTDTVHSLTWTADSSLLASGGLDGSVRLWDVNASGSRDFGDENAGNSNCSVEQVACYGGTLCENVNDLRYSRQGTLLVTGFSNSVGREAALSAAVAKTAAASVAAAASNNGQQQQQQLFHQQNPTVKVIKSEPMMNGGGGGGIGDWYEFTRICIHSRKVKHTTILHTNQKRKTKSMIFYTKPPFFVKRVIPGAWLLYLA